METHSLKDVGRNSGYVRLDGTMTWSLEDWGDAVLHNASSWRNVMKKRNLVLCMLIYEYAPRKKPRRKIPTKCKSSGTNLLFRASGISSVIKHGDATCAQRMKCRANGVYYGLSIVRFCDILRTLRRCIATLSLLGVANLVWDTGDP